MLSLHSCLGKKLLTFPSNQSEKNSVKTFVERGFDNWKKALKTFSVHEKSQVHRSAAVANASVDKGVNVLATLSQNKLKEMKNARQALLKILSSLHFLSQQGLAIRGHTDETSNIRQLLLLRSEDVPELKIWLQRSKFKWLSHDILNELLSLLAFEVLNNLLLDIRSAQFFSIIIDETTDLSTKEQVSVCFRYVNASLEIEETFLGFYETPSTTASSLFTIAQDVLLRFNLNIENCRGQCYDGAANVSGAITGLQSRIKELEPRAIYVHCAAHTLNLVVQDSMQNITEVRDFLVVIRDLISFVKGSPKRLAAFTNIQQTTENEGEMQTSSLRPFCPTRWCLRIKSLQTVEKNFHSLLLFLNELSNNCSEIGGKASGFLKFCTKFETLFLIKTMILIFERLEHVNAAMQKKSLCFRDINSLVDNLIAILTTKRDNGFAHLWKSVKECADELGLDEPSLSRPRKLPRRFDEGSTAHMYNSPEDMYRRLFLEIVDRAISSLKERFKKETMQHMDKLEKFAITSSDTEGIISFYGDDFNEGQLILHRDMFLDICKTKGVILNSLCDVVSFLKNADSVVLNVLSEYVKFIRIILTIPVSSCTAERSFSALRRLKTYLRTTMSQSRLNDLAVLHVHKSQKPNFDAVADMFIKKNETRRNAFFVE